MEYEEPSGLNMIEDTEELINDTEYRHFKQITNQIETFDNCIKNAPGI